MNSVPITRYVTQHYIVTWLVLMAIATMDYVCQQSLVQTIKPVTCSMYVPTIIIWDTRLANITWTLEQLCVWIVMANLSCGRKSHNKVYMIIAPFMHYLLYFFWNSYNFFYIEHRNIYIVYINDFQRLQFKNNSCLLKASTTSFLLEFWIHIEEFAYLPSHQTIRKSRNDFQDKNCDLPIEPCSL